MSVGLRQALQLRMGTRTAQELCITFKTSSATKIWTTLSVAMTEVTAAGEIKKN